jgi:phytoene synthase
MDTPPSAEAITRASKSNFALAFIALPPERRRDLTTFYAFCRVVDDIADEPGRSTEEKASLLAAWKRAVCEAFAGEPPLAPQIRELIGRYRLNPQWLLELIQGCEMDLVPARYETFEDLRLYCYRVASVVGLVSIEIFGYQNEATQHYAVELGQALQLTNILRDVGKDLANDGRVYLPLADLARFGIDPSDLATRKGGPRFGELMAFEARRAEGLYQSAIAQLPPEDRRSMRPAEIMRCIYHRILQKMSRDRFQVFEKQYRLGKFEKLAIASRVLLLGR